MCWLQKFGGDDMLHGALFTSPEHRGRSCSTRGNKPPLESLKQSAYIRLELLVHRANQWASMDVCDKKTWEMWRHHELLPLSRGNLPTKRLRPRPGGKKNDITTISQRATRIVEGASTEEDEDIACPRCDRELYVFHTASGPILRCRGWTLARNTVYA